MRPLRYFLLGAFLATGVTVAGASVPQTITIDGTNDFNAANLVENETNDTQAFTCTNPTDHPLDIGRVYITNDASYLYFGYDYKRWCFCDMNLGLAIDVNTAGGGTADPFGRKIGWTGVPFKPDFVLYDVIPTSCNGYNYEVLYKDNLPGAPPWVVLHDGPNGMGVADADGGNFVEGRILLSDLGVSTGSTIHYEIWVTQDATTKGPLDASFGDAVQMSRVGQTTFDTTAVVQMPGMHTYTILNAVDNTPPTVNTAVATSFQLLANKTFSPVTTKVDVVFDEPVEQVSAETEANYAYAGPLARTISSAVLDAGTPTLVHLTLSGNITQNAAFQSITVTGVKDMANNTIVANGNTNVGAFFIQAITFNGNMKLRLCKGEFAVTDTFSVEGSLSPLTFTVADNARMSDANSDSVYTGTVPFSLPRDRTTLKAEADLFWKFSHTPAGDAFEPGSNRFLRISSDSGATVAINASWANDNVADFTDKPVDVIFRVDANPPYLPVSATRKIWLRGSELPLSFASPGLAMKDDGVAPDAAAGDRIFTLKVRFPRCSPKNVRWKVVYDSTATDTVYECPSQGDREVFVNSAAFDTVGGAHGALSLPSRGVNRCSVTDKAIRVVFRVDMTPASPAPGVGDTVGVASDSSPLGRPNLPPASIMADNGVSPDAASGDKVFTRQVTFPDSTSINTTYKFWYDNWTNGGYECEGFGDRNLKLDDYTYSVANPIILPIYAWNYCANLVDVPFTPIEIGAGADFAVLRQSFPNPISSKTTIFFDLKRGGRVSLTIYDITGRRMARVFDRELAPGPQSVVWDGRDGDGHRLGSGVYVYELASGGDRISRRMVVTR